ncbi:shikimate dehydrogenase [Virgisporangium aurantiacum]|uniref:Shikimate 5-dehydrogenase n=1 Tax=Virgisporangium aurantiacum TaxID=175570 RepID=A0A8J3ZAD9_9ACTN|nr:shikimate dehydrogenase [Virgisporangium aurantiacum]GIJ58170.1 shikimate 5-dehydrogenase [Virgisporangium aurantiacum]
MLNRAAVLGLPVSHSLSPAMHTAGYAAAGLDASWQYTAVDCAEGELAAFVESLDETWHGLSLTMPLKEVALTVADRVDPLARALGAANTLVRGADGWTAYNTDAPGITDALRTAGAGAGAGTGAGRSTRMAILGGGGTARAALGAAVDLGAGVTLYVRRPEAGEDLRPVAHALGVPMTVETWGRAADAATYDVVISTVPKGGADALAVAAWAAPTVVFDVVYDPWPTPLAESARRAECPIVSGLDLLLAQGVRQFELFTGVPAPVEAMRAALQNRV